MYENHSQSDIPINKKENHGCQASIGCGEKCGEVKTLEILKEFQQLYENKLREIKDDCSCTSTRLKIQMLEDWVKDLTEQNTMLVQVVEELEQEASERVSLLEEKLRHSSKTSFEIMKTLQHFDAQNISNQSDILQRLMYFQSDVNNLTEFIRRIREDGNWSTEGLHFYSVAQEDLYEFMPTSARNLSKQRELEDSLEKLKIELSKSKKRQDEYEKETKFREILIREQTEQIEKLNEVVERCASTMPDKQKLLEEMHEVRAHLKQKTDDFSRLELFEFDAKDQEDEDLKKQILQLKEENKSLHNTISNGNAELTVLHGLVEQYNKELNETMNNFINRINVQLSSDNMLVIQEVDSKISAMTESERESQNSENEFNKTIFLLKTDISKMILWKSDNDMTELKKQVSNIENTIHEIQSKDQLIKNKDEMINIQNDTLNVAQRELKELREKLIEIEKERDTRIQEVHNLQQALKINQNTIEELEKALKNSEEKANNIQQTADLYVETINLLENAKNKAENEMEQQRITIGNLQDALVNTKKQLEGVQGHSAAELKEKSDAIYTLYQEIDEMQTQYMDCYGENVKLSQTADCLRDANLQLKVININLLQDIEELNSKIMNDKIIIASMEEHIRKILTTNELLEGDINFMKEEMGNLSTELKVLQDILKISASGPSLEENNINLTKSFNILQEHSETLVNQLKLTQKQMSREIEQNDINSGKISELQKIVDTKVEELQETKFELDLSVRQTNEYENKLKEMEQRVKEFQKLQDLNDKKTDEMVLTCNSDLNCLRQKTDTLNKILNEKSNEILCLHAELSIKSDTISNLIKENENAIKDNKKLAENAQNLQEQLHIYKSRSTEMAEKYNKCQTDVDTMKKWEDTIHEDYRREKKILTEKLEMSQREEIKLNSILRENKEELEKAKHSLKQIDDEAKNFTCAQEEILSLKEEINRLTKLRNRFLCDNQKQQDQISKLSVDTAQFENRNLIISEQLDKCLEELTNLQCIKDKLEERNVQLETEVEHLQGAFNELNHEIRYKVESFMNIEHELSEIKCSKEEICTDSKMVLSSVRNWLENQRRINIVLRATIKEKNTVIDELTMEKTMLLKNIKEVCERYESLTEELHACREYLTEMNFDRKMIKSSTPKQRSIYTLGYQGSEGESPSTSPIFIDEHNSDYMYDDNDNDGEPNPARWMRKVQNMSEDLLKSKKYWQTKMVKPKKIKPVKESKTT